MWRNTGTLAYCTSAVNTAITSDIEKEIKVKGIVTLIPGTKIFPNESKNIVTSRSENCNVFTKNSAKTITSYKKAN